MFRNDLYDCNIEICSPEVPALFTENFDYEDLRQDLVNGVLTSDLISKNIYCYIAKTGYVANINSFEEYWRTGYVPAQKMINLVMILLMALQLHLIRRSTSRMTRLFQKKGQYGKKRMLNLKRRQISKMLLSAADPPSMEQLQTVS